MDKEFISGKYTSATIFKTSNTNNNIDQYAINQIQRLCDTDVMEKSRIRIMPDVHPGKVGTIGFTATVGKRVMPLLLGIDIGCGMSVTHITKGKKEWPKLDRIINENIPSGSNIRQKPHSKADDFDFSALYCLPHIQIKRVLNSLGTLGGGNHFIEVDIDDNNEMYLVIHSGSRIFGKDITEHYMNAGQKILKANGIDIPYELTWIENELLDNYLNDIAIAQQYAELNRRIISDEIIKGMKWKADYSWSCPHNYVSFDDETISSFGTPLLRKGAISAKKDEKVIVPINMRDGIILGTGLGNTEWNWSAPHGAGRIMKREDIKNNFTLSSFKKEMKGIYSNCISADTLDEAPFAYRNIEDILEAIKETVNVETIAKPVYNYKAGSAK